MSDKQKIVHTLLDMYKTTFAEDAGIELTNEPAPLFQLLCMSLIYSTRISHTIAGQTIQELFDAGWTTPKKMLHADRQEVIRVLDEADYARYDESTASYLEEDARRILEKYNGDLRNLREDANRNVHEERNRLDNFKGLGDVGVTIFMRDVQSVWEEVYPFADRKALNSAKKLGLPDNTDDLKALAGDGSFVRLIDALVKADLDNNHEGILEKAGVTG